MLKLLKSDRNHHLFFKNRCTHLSNELCKRSDYRFLSSISSNKDNSKISNSNSSTTEHIAILMKLRKYIWPDNSEISSYYIKSRVIASFSLLIASKSLNIYVPFIFKQLVDHFQENTGNLSIIFQIFVSFFFFNI